MYKFLLLFFLLQSFEVAAQNIRPSKPVEGQTVEARVLFFCPDYPAENVQGLNSLVEINDQNVISLYVVYESIGGCPGVRPPPIPVYFALGDLSEGTYTLNVYRVDSNQALPIQNVLPDEVNQFEVRGAPVAVNAWSYGASILMVLGVFLIVLFAKKIKPNRVI